MSPYSLGRASITTIHVNHIHTCLLDSEIVIIPPEFARCRELKPRSRHDPGQRRTNAVSATLAFRCHAQYPDPALVRTRRIASSCSRLLD
jgi:hypothetical protein